MQNQSSDPDSQSEPSSSHKVTAEESDILIEKEDEEEEDAKNQEASEADMRDVAESKPLDSDPDDLPSAVPAQPGTPVLAIKEVVGPGPGRQTMTKTLTLMEKPWRDIHWGQDRLMTKRMEKKMIEKNPDVEHLRILVHGPVGAGKSSFINSINSIFQRRMTQALKTDHSFPEFKIHKIRDDTTTKCLLLEKRDSEEVHPEDIIKVLRGQIKFGYKFNPTSSCSDTDPNFVSNPTLSNTIHCLVSVVPADRVTLMEDDDFEKMKLIRQQASEMGIPQLIILTKVDLACPEVQKNIKKIYRSKKIKEKMQECSNRLGGHMTDIFPVRNYHEEIDMNPDVNMLLLSALKPILNHANDYVEDNKPGWSVFSFLSWFFGQ
ncbi:interferon-induced protein 44-like isoform X2 [Alosa pseudoharengus]